VADEQRKRTPQSSPAPTTSQETGSTHWTRTAGGVASIIAIAVAFFGAGTFANLKDRITGDYYKKQTAQFSHSSAANLYFSMLNASCRTAVVTAGGSLQRPDKVTLSWLNTMLNARTRFADTWASQNVGGLTDTEQAEMAAARSRFRAASGFWGALTADFKANDVSGYDAHVGQYYEAMADYLATLHRTGTHDGCAVAWPTPNLLIVS
jgi:hypothetical protein